MLVRLQSNLYVAAFSIMKLLPAAYIIERAEKNGLIVPNSLVVETTSGTFGLGLAMVCAERGYRLTLVGDVGIDATLRGRIAALGADLRVVAEPAPNGGLQKARMDLLEVLRHENNNAFWPAQYDNPEARHAYDELAEMLCDRVGTIDCLVGTVGTGGSACGTGAALRSLRSDAVQVIGVDTHGSVLFGQADKPGRLLRGLGNSLMPLNVQHHVFDEIHWVNAGDAFKATQILCRKYGLYMGPTSGAAWLVADWHARKSPKSVVVAILPDEGHRYQSTVYNADWIAEKGLTRASLPSNPLTVENPAFAIDEWSRFAWGRRTRAEVPCAEKRA